jgi:hypothetical protein
MNTIRPPLPRPVDFAAWKSGQLARCRTVAKRVLRTEWTASVVTSVNGRQPTPSDARQLARGAADRARARRFLDDLDMSREEDQPCWPATAPMFGYHGRDLAGLVCSPEVVLRASVGGLIAHQLNKGVSIRTDTRFWLPADGLEVRDMHGAAHIVHLAPAHIVGLRRGQHTYDTLRHGGHTPAQAAEACAHFEALG